MANSDWFVDEKDLIATAQPSGGDGWYVQPEDVGIKQQPVQQEPPQRLDGGIKQFDNWLGQFDMVKDSVKALDQQRSMGSGVISDLYNSHIPEGLPLAPMHDDLAVAKGVANAEGLLNFGDSILNFAPGLIQQGIGIKPEDRRYFDMAGTFRKNNPTAEYVSKTYPEFYNQQASTAEMAGPFPNVSVAKILTKIPLAKQLGGKWLQAIENGSAKALVGDAVATGAAMGLQGVPNKALKEKKEIKTEDALAAMLAGGALGGAAGGLGVGLSKVVSAGLNKIGKKVNGGVSIAGDVAPDINLDQVAGEDSDLAAILATLGGKKKGPDAVQQVKDLVSSVEDKNYQEMVLDKVAPQASSFDPINDFLKGSVSLEREVAAREKLGTRAQSALDGFLNRATKEVQNSKIRNARNQAAKQQLQMRAQNALDTFLNRANKDIQSRAQAASKEAARNQATVKKFMKHIEKVEQINQKEILSPEIDPVSDFLRGQRRITKTSKQTFAVEAQNNNELEKRLNKAIQDKDVKAADAINEEIAKRVKSESVEPDLEPIPQEDIASSVDEIEQALNDVEWDMTYGYGRGELGYGIDEAVGAGIIDDEAAELAKLFGQASHEKRLNDATYEQAGKILMKRYGVDELELDGVKFTKSKESDPDFTEAGHKELTEFKKGLPARDTVSGSQPSHMRAVPNGPLKNVVELTEDMPDAVLTTLAREAVQKRPGLDKFRKEISAQLKAKYEQMGEKPILNYPVDENLSFGIEYISASNKMTFGASPEQQEAAVSLANKIQEMLLAGSAYLKDGVNVRLTKKKLALFAGASSLVQFFAGQSAEAADMTSKAIDAQSALTAMSLPNMPEAAALVSFILFHSTGLSKKVSEVVDKFVNTPGGKLFALSNVLWHDTQDRIEMLGRIIGDKSLAKARIEITAKINQLYFGKEMGDPEVAARALHELRTEVVSPQEALAGTHGAFKELTKEQREAVLYARGYQAQLASIHKQFSNKLQEFKENLKKAIIVAPHLAQEINGKLKDIERLESSLQFEDSRIGLRDRSHIADKVTNVIASGFGEFQFGSRNYAFQLMNLFTDSGILGASYTGAKNYANAVKDLRLDGDLRKLFKNSNLAGQRKQDIATGTAEGGLYKTARFLDKINPGKLLPEFDAEKINADHFALAQAYKYFETNISTIRKSGFNGDRKDFAKSLFSSNSKDLNAVVRQDAWNDISVGLWRSHGVDPLGINTNFFNEAPVSRMLTFFTKQPARTARMMTHYIAKGEWRKLYTMLGFIAVAGGSAALPVELQFLGSVLAPEQMAEFEKRLDSLEIYRRLNPHRTMTPKTEYGAFLWPVMGSVNPVLEEASDLMDRQGNGAVGSLINLLEQLAHTGKADDKAIEKVINASATYLPVKGLNLAIKFNKGMQENQAGNVNLYPKNEIGKFDPKQKRTVSLQELERDPNTNLFNKTLMPGVDRAQYELQRDNQEKTFNNYFGRQGSSKKVFDFEKFLRGG